MRVVYTSITPGYDLQREDVHLVDPVDVFKIQAYSTRAPKLLPHVYVPGYNEYMWVDGNVYLTKPHDYYFTTYLDGYDIATFKHPIRSTIAAEVDVLKKMPYYPKIATVGDQLKSYQSEEYNDSVLYASYVFMSRMSDEVKAFFSYWWRELVKWQYRDQVSLPYVLSKFSLKVNIIGNDVLNHKDFTYRKHTRL